MIEMRKFLSEFYLRNSKLERAENPAIKPEKGAEKGTVVVTAVIKGTTTVRTTRLKKLNKTVSRKPFSDPDLISEAAHRNARVGTGFCKEQ